jgi:hypothetical protein
VDIRAFLRGLHEQLPSVVSTVIFALTLFVLVVGELQSLSALASAQVEKESPRTPFAAVVIGVVVIAFLALFGVPDENAERGESLGREGLRDAS